MTHAILYTMDNCPYCERAKRLLEARQIDTTIIDISGDYDEINRLSNRTGMHTLPQIWVDDVFVGGCDDLIRLDSAGKLR